MEPTRDEFLEEMRQWRDATRYVSDTTAIASNRHGKNIVAMGRAAIPWLLYLAQLDPCRCVLIALRQITGVDPVAPGDEGRLDAMAAAWVGWGMRRGHI